MAKKLSKILWHDTKVDGAGKPVLPSVATDDKGLNGLLPGELFMHVGKEKVSLWALSLSGKVVEVSGKTDEVDIDLSDYLLKSVWDSVFEIKTDVSGQKYIFGKLPVVTKYGITMYADDGNVDIPQLAEGLPFDQRTIWFNPETEQIEVIGGTGGGEADSVAWANVYGKPSWITDTKPTYNYSEIKGTPDLSVFVTHTALNKTLADYATLTYLTGELKKYVTLDGAQDIKGVKNFVNGLKIGGLPITKKQDDVVYLDANLVVRGGITMYAENEVDIPSILDSLPIANANTQDKASKGIASFDSAYFKVTDGWVTLTSAPSIVSILGRLQDVSPSASGTTNSDVVLFKSANSNTWTTKPLSEIGGSGGGSVSGNYLPLSGGTLSNGTNTPLAIKGSADGSWIAFYNQSDVFRGSIGFQADNQPYAYHTDYGACQILHTGNYSSYALPLSGGTCRWINIDFTSSLDPENSVFIIKRNDRGRFIEFQGAVDYFKGVYNFTHTSTNLDIHVFNKGTSYISALQTGSSLPNMDISGCSFTIGDWRGSKFYFDAANIRLGIGTPKPSAALHVNGSTLTKSIGLIEQGEGLYRIAHIGMNSTYGLYIEAGTNADSWQGTLLPIFFGWRGATKGMILDGSKNLLVYGGITMYSDQRKKTILNHVELSLKQIANAPLIEHYYNSDQEKTTHVGSIAQYWAELNDWFCKLDNEGYYTMEIQNCALASAISIARHLEKYESKTDKKIRQLKKRISQLEDELELLKKGV